MFQAKTDFVATCAFFACFMFSQVMAYNEVSAVQIVFMNLPRILMSVTGVLLYNKTIDVFVKLLSERDYFQSGHLQFVHSLKEGFVVADVMLENIKLFNVAARQMLELPF